MKRILATAAVAVAMITGTAFAATEGKIGTVDLQRAVTESKEGSAARADLLKRTERLNGELKQLLAETEKLRGEIEKEGAKMREEERAEKQRQLQTKAREFQLRQAEAQEELKQMENAALKKLVAKFGAILSRIGADGDYSAILDRNSGVYYAGKKNDVTHILVQQADKEYQR